MSPIAFSLHPTTYYLRTSHFIELSFFLFINFVKMSLQLEKLS